MSIAPLPAHESHRSFLSILCAFVNHIRATLADLASAVALAILFPFNEEKWLDPKKKADCNPNQTPILLIHGFLGSSNNWVYHRYRLIKAGYTNIFTVNLGDPRKSIEDYTEVVRKKVDEIKRITGQEDIVLVGHSMGGLVAQNYRYTAQGAQQHVKKIITIGTPLHGTRIAHLASWISQAAKEMIFQSPFVERLQEMAAKDVDTKYDAISTEPDHIVIPASSAHGKRKDPKPLKATGHISYLFSPSTAKHLVDSVKEAIPLAATLPV